MADKDKSFLDPFVDIGKGFLKDAGEDLPDWVKWGGSLAFLGGLALAFTAAAPVAGAALMYGAGGLVGGTAVLYNGPKLLCKYGGTALAIGLGVAVVSPVGLTIAAYAGCAVALGAAWYYVRNKLKARPGAVNLPASAAQPEKGKAAPAKEDAQEEGKGEKLTVTDRMNSGRQTVSGVNTKSKAPAGNSRQQLNVHERS